MFTERVGPLLDKKPLSLKKWCTNNGLSHDYMYRNHAGPQEDKGDLTRAKQRYMKATKIMKEVQTNMNVTVMAVSFFLWTILFTNCLSETIIMY